MSNRQNTRFGEAQRRRQERLQHQLEVQSQQIERVLSQHQLPARIAGGTVQPRTIRFDFGTPLAQGWERLRGLTQELKNVLKVPDVRVSREDGQLRLHVTRPEKPPVTLLDLLPMLPDLPPLTATLGLAEDGRPVLLDFANPDVTHVLLAGGADAGKTTLLRTLAMSLAIKNRQSQLQMLLIDPETADSHRSYTILEPLVYLPHMLTGISYLLEEAVEILNFLQNEMDYRRQQQAGTPTILLLIDKADHLLAVGGEPISTPLTALLQHGAGAGIHLVLSTRQPETAVLNNLLRANLPVRLVGQVDDEPAANAAAGMLDTRAEYLLGQGDFLAFVGGETTHFQAAYIGDYDLHMCLDDLHRNRPLPLLARPATMRPTLAPEDEPAAPEIGRPQLFSFNGQAIKIED